MTHILFLDQQTKKTIKVSKEMKQKYIVKLIETERSQLKDLISSDERQPDKYRELTSCSSQTAVPLSKLHGWARLSVFPPAK